MREKLAQLFGITYQEAQISSCSLPCSKRQLFFKEKYQRGDQGSMHMVLHSNVIYNNEKLETTKKSKREINYGTSVQYGIKLS